MSNAQYQNINTDYGVADEYYGQDFAAYNQNIYYDPNSYMNNEYSYNTQYSGVYSDNLNNDYSHDNYYGHQYYGYNPNVALDYYNQQYVIQSAQEDDEPFITAKDILHLGICIVLAFLLAYLIVTYVAQHTMVSGTSMAYNLADKDILIIDRLTYSFSEPQRFDIVVFPVRDDVFYIKRIIGLPGETVRIDKESGLVFINDIQLPEDYGFEIIKQFGDVFEVILSDDEYFVMGDNRNDSEDSRSSMIGNIPRDMLTGKAIFRIWPFDTFGQIDNTVNARIKSGQLEAPQR